MIKSKEIKSIRKEFSLKFSLSRFIFEARGWNFISTVFLKKNYWALCRQLAIYLLSFYQHN